MYKFIDSTGAEVWVKPEAVTSITRSAAEAKNNITIRVGPETFKFSSDDDTDNKRFLYYLFEAMGEEYLYE